MLLLISLFFIFIYSRQRSTDVTSITHTSLCTQAENTLFTLHYTFITTNNVSN